MGATSFQHFVPDEDRKRTLQEAFDLVYREAELMYGMDPYSGTIATKYSVTLIDPKPVNHAYAMFRSNEMLSDPDSPAYDKYGPACAFRVEEPDNASGYYLFGTAPE